MTVRLDDPRQRWVIWTVSGAWVLALVAAAWAPAAAQEGVPCELAPAGAGTVADVVDGDTVVLEDGREVRLVGIQAPKLPLGREGFEEWPLAREAKAALENLVLGAEVRLSHGGQAMDRHGRVLAHLHLDGGAGPWVQGEMLARGLARAYSFADNRACARELQALEREARAKARGIWALPYYAVRSARRPDRLERMVDTFQLVEGTVRQVAIVRGRVYINFGEDYRTDFTASVDPEDVGTFPRRGRGLKVLEGQSVRIRGWLGRLNGPMIEVSHPEQIELVGAQARPGG